MRDIRELTGDPEAYRAELQRRWAGLLSYRYIGRHHSSMNLGPEDNTVRIRRDMRNDGGWDHGGAARHLVARGLPGRPGGGAQPGDRLRAGPRRRGGRGGDRGARLGPPAPGRTMGYGRCRIVDAAGPDRVLAFIDGQGASIGEPPEGLERMDVSEAELVIEDSPDLPPLWQVFGAANARRRALGAAGAPGRAGIAGRRAAHRPPARRAGDGGARAGGRAGGHPPGRGAELARHVHGRGKAGPFRVEGTAYGAPGGLIGVRLLLHDEGNGDRPITSASAVVAVLG